MAKAISVSEGTYHKLDKVMQSDNEEVKQQLREKKISVDKAYREIKNPKPKEEQPIASEQKIIEFDNRMNEIDKEISLLMIEREALMRKRSSLFESLEMKCELKYEFVEKEYSFWESRDCQFYIEVNGHKQIFVKCSVYCDESPDDIWLREVPEKYKNDFIMLWKKAHKEEVKYNKEQKRERTKKLENEYREAFIQDHNKYKDFYKQCYRTLAKSVHPDEGGNVEAMQCLNQLKAMWGI